MSCPQYGLVDSIDLTKMTGSREAVLSRLAMWTDEFYRSVLHLCRHRDIELWIEKAFLSNSGARSLNATLSLAEVSTVVRVSAPWAAVEQVIPATWKAAVTGYGRADKEDIQAWLALNDPELAEFCQREDEYDASCIGYYGQMRLEFGITPPERKPRARRRAADRG